MSNGSEGSGDRPHTVSGAGAADRGTDLVARAGRYYRNTRYIMFALLVGMGGWFAYDGWVKYPAENAKVAELKAKQQAASKAGDEAELGRINADLKNYSEHNSQSLLIQRVLGFALPPVGVAMLLWSLHRSRGEYRLSGSKLSVPGHPTVDLDDIREVNSDLWERKGIAWLKYETASGHKGEICLDDFIYDRPPTDAIYDRIVDELGLADEEEDGDPSEEEPDGGDEPAGTSNGAESDGERSSRAG